jgi:DNA-binding transcriptional regulator YdaS (Cro superfamily)
MDIAAVVAAVASSTAVALLCFLAKFIFDVSNKQTYLSTWAEGHEALDRERFTAIERAIQHRENMECQRFNDIRAAVSRIDDRLAHTEKFEHREDTWRQ